MSSRAFAWPIVIRVGVDHAAGPLPIALHERGVRRTNPGQACSRIFQNKMLIHYIWIYIT